MATDYDVIILGSGPAGFACAMQSSKFDKKALVVEANEKFLGGAWINSGTVPSKALKEAAKTIFEFNRQFGDEQEHKPYERFEMKDLLQYKNRILESENQKVKNDLIKNEVDTVRGYGTLVDEHTVEVADHIGKTHRYTAEYILVATGSSPIHPEKFSVDNEHIFDTQSILDLTHIPRRLVIAGAGVNAFEYATTFAALGTKVTILNDRDDFLPFLDHEVKEQLIEIFNERRITIHNNVQLDAVSYNPIRVCTEARYHPNEDEKNVRVLETEHVLYIGGRKPNTSKLNLDKAGVEMAGEGLIKIDDHYRTNVSSIFAAGDVVGHPALASASFMQGRMAACFMFGIPTKDDKDHIPFGIYSIPEMAHIGLNEKDAAERGLDVTVGRAYYRNTTQADISNQTHGILKLIFDSKTLKLYGVHIFGERACDLLHLGQAVMALDGDIRYFVQHIMNYPTYSEAYRTAAFNGLNRVHKAGVKYKHLLKNKEAKKKS